MRRFLLLFAIAAAAGFGLNANCQSVQAYRDATYRAHFENLRIGLGGGGSGTATFAPDYFTQGMRRPTDLEFATADASLYIAVIGGALLLFGGPAALKFLATTGVQAAAVGHAVKKANQASDKTPVESRLRSLRRLRDSQEISEAEYEAKRKEILAQL